MPNHVYNIVRVAGDPRLVELLDKAVRTDSEQLFDFNRIIPRPPIVDEVCSEPIDFGMMADNPNRNWYDWQINNWGSKWNAYDFDVEQSSAGCYRFCTAWSPPLPVIDALSRLFPEVQIEIESDDPFDGVRSSVTFGNGKPLPPHCKLEHLWRS